MPLRHTLKISALSFAMLAVFAAAAIAAPAPPKGGKGAPPADAAGDKDKPYGEWKKLTKDTDVAKGFFTTYRKRENLYLEIRADQFEKPFLGIFSFASGIGSNFVLGGLPLNDRLLEFQRAGDRVLVIEKNIRFRAPQGSAIEKAVELSYGNSVIASLKVESVNDSTKAVLVDFAKFLVSDVSDLAEGLKGALDKSVRFDPERSTVTTTKMFPENFEAEALLTYSPNDRTNFGLEGVSDDRFIPIKVHYSFSKLPDVPMQPRLADERVGYFLTVHKDFSRDTDENFWVRFVDRWRLEKKDPTAALSEPVKPIVYYIDRTVPAEYRPWVKEAVEKWQKAFEAAGFKNAILAKDAPDDSTWDAEDVRYSTLRWITSTQPSFGAIGPSRVDPRTGEILDADILFEASMFQNGRNAYRRYSGPDQIAEQALPETRLRSLPSWLALEDACEVGAVGADGLALQQMAMLVDGSMPPGSPVPTEYLHDFVVWVVMHEVGHTLGLRHNFRSSTSTPYDKLNDKAWIAEHGMYSSVMEYPTPNISLDRTKQGYYWTQGAGTEDLFRIRYAYTPSGEKDPWKDYGVVQRIAQENLAPGNEYSSDDDTYLPTSPDPRSNIYDLGDDPLRFAKDRTAYLSSLWRNPNFEDRILGADGSYPVLRRALDTAFGQYGIALGFGVKYLGGSEITRVRKGQPGERTPVAPIPASKQREALDFLAQRAFAADAFAVNPVLLTKLASDRWAHWGMNFASRADYDLAGTAFAIQNALLNGLTSPFLLARMRETESRNAGALTLAEYFDGLTKALWGEVGGGVASAAAFRALNGPNTRREAQRAFVDKLANMVVSPSPIAPDDARALARLALTRIDARCARVLAGEAPMGDNVRAHLMETRARVKRALEAGREADAAPARGPGGPFATPSN